MSVERRTAKKLTPFEDIVRCTAQNMPENIHFLLEFSINSYFNIYFTASYKMHNTALDF